MFALLKKLLGLDSATRLYKGIVSLDRQALVIRTVVTRVVSLNSTELTVHANHSRIKFGEWTVRVDGGDVSLRYDIFPNFSDELFSTQRGYSQPQHVFVKRIRGDLSVLVDGLRKKFPSSAETYEYYFDAADAF